MADFELDLRGIACPMNFVKTRLFLDKIAAGDLLKVTLDDGEPFESVTASVRSEGHVIEDCSRVSEGACQISIRKS